MDERNEPFLARWSRLKQGKPAEPPPSQTPAASAEAPPTAPAVQEPALELPDIETLTKDSDFSAFLRAEVPADLQRQALRKLWASDPIFSHHDGLTDYADDYHNLPMGEAVKTAWKVGRGLLDAVDSAVPQKSITPPSEIAPSSEEVAAAPAAAAGAQKTDKNT